MGVLAIAGDPVDIAHAGADGQAVQQAGFDVVAQPGAGHVTRGINGALALLFRAALLVANIRVGVRRLHTQAVGQLTNRLQLNAFGFDFTNGTVRIGRLLFSGNVLLVDAEHRSAELAVHPFWLILHARFPLLALHRIQDIALLVGKAGRRKGGGVADVRRNAVIKQIQQRRAAAEVVFIQIAAGVVKVVDVRHAHLVVTPAERQAPAVNGHLIL